MSSFSIDDLATLPDSDALANEFGRVHYNLVQIFHFNPKEHANPVETRNRLLATAGEVADSFERVLVPNVGYLIFRDKEPQRFRNDIDQVVANAREQIGRSFLKQNLVLAKRRRKLQRLLLGQEGPPTQLKQPRRLPVLLAMRQNSRWRRKSNEKSPGAGSPQAVFGMALVIGLSFYFFQKISENQELSDPRTIQQILLRLLAITSVSYVTILAFRMFRTERHLAVGNQHRQLALATFETFAEGSKDDATRDAVLLEASRAIFTHPSTGLVGKSEPQSHPSPMLEVIRSQSQSE